MTLACGNRRDEGRTEIEAQLDELTETVKRLIALAEAVAGDVAELAAGLLAGLCAFSVVAGACNRRYVLAAA